jgi:hypothetical protein
MVECVGCGEDFSVKGYTYHIHMTSHQPCISAYEEEVRKVVASLQDASDGAHQQLNEDIITPPFGAEALNWEADNWEGEESDTELDEDGIDITDKLTELPNQPDEGVVSKQPQADRQSTSATHRIADKDWHTEEYPLASAGSSFTQNHFSTDDEENRRNVSADGVYGPFQSRMNWEFARWAKYESISSNALTRLLSVDGISYLIYHIECFAEISF